ncbi:prolyl oligopeptidase family serine peptidase [Muricauda sp. 334s03]|uniref:Prolyl oligopeptidase family serine peptidase n=1 Tax=Flagellimonas yonaguniensis TaxID=3031325 RepID=A0ABT5Y0C8_9FLAO|nr:prolyl oligopeptidase family serine peptidase [[Muricauda] yonaguniensis]MDF0716899.1 prolyl oligopeptidase family serine peptidase [[Muricauda] yonaguniensis]
MRRFFTFTVAFLLTFNILQAQKENTSSLKIKDIMQGNDFVGPRPSSAYWSTDGQILYFDWNPSGAMSDSLYAYSMESKDLKKVDFLSANSLPSSRLTYNKAKTEAVYSKNGDIFLLDVDTYQSQPITKTQERESNPHFTDDGKSIAFVMDGELFTWNIASGFMEQKTHFVKSKKSEPQRDSKDEWLYQDQLDIFDVLKERKTKRDAGEQISKKLGALQPLELETEGKRVISLQIDPSGSYITYILMDRPNSKGTIVPHFVTESGYTEDQNTRSKVGDEPTQYEMFVYNVKNRESYPVVLDNLKGLDYVPEYTKDYPDKPYKNENRIGFINGPTWNSDGTKAILDIQANDYKDRWIVLLDPKTGKVEQLDRQHDEAWIAGPGISRWGGGSLGWMPDNKSIWFMSEKTGYSHLYTLNVNNKKTRALTSGKFEIYGAELSKDKSRWYFTSNKTHPGDRQFYSMSLKGGKWEQLTNMVGRNDVVLSPNEEKMAILYSYSNKPTELFIQNNPIETGGNPQTQQITYSNTDDFNAYDWKDPEIITFKASDGADVHARLYQPEASVKNKAAVIFVHGAGYLQNAHKWWSSYFREYMFHNLLVDNGYTVLDIDYRGSAGYGRDWRTGIYRHMGGKDLSDQVDGAKMLVDEYGIDTDKIGIYGGSYGGFITLMGMFNAPDTFSAGAAIRSVGDWAAYNHGYTARILNTPATDSLAYKRSSPIYFADGLQGDLLILHGMVDDNVHFQDMVRLSQRLIELGKENWEMAVYPVERHGFVEPSSWIDEYTRIFKLFQKSLLGKE